jgi:hypothetical protein
VHLLTDASDFNNFPIVNFPHATRGHQAGPLPRPRRPLTRCTQGDEDGSNEKGDEAGSMIYRIKVTFVLFIFPIST